MHPLQHQYMVEHHRQDLLRRAEYERIMHNVLAERQDQTKSRYFWYQALDLPLPFYDAQHASITQALTHDWLRRRTKSIILTVSFSAFGLGVLSGGLLGNKLDLVPVILLSSSASLIALLPILIRLLPLLKQSLSRPALR